MTTGSAASPSSTPSRTSRRSPASRHCTRPPSSWSRCSSRAWSPPTDEPRCAGFEELLDTYEAAHFAYDEKARAVADATLELLVSFYPRFMGRAVHVFSRALMDDPLLDAFGYDKPSRLVVALSRGGLVVRARVERLLPARRRPRYVRDLARIKTYPGGFLVERLGTFPPVAGTAPADGGSVTR